jgi:hypothetical protein
MSPSKPGWKCPNFSILNSLFTISVSPLSRHPGCSGGSSASNPQSNPGGCPADYPARNPKSYLAGCWVSYLASYLEENSASYLADCPDRRPAGCVADCSEDCSEGSPERNLPGNGEDSLISYSESNSADSPAGCAAGSENRTAAGPTCRSGAGVRSPLLTSAHLLVTLIAHPHYLGPGDVKAVRRLPARHRSV